MSSSADLLRRAAVKLREYAEAATPGPWSWTGDRYPQLVLQGRDAADDDGMVSFNLAGRPAEDARFTALMHPPVALALADLIEEGLDYASMHEPERYPVYVKAVAAARTVLREPEETP